MTQPVKTVIFDIGNVLVDWNPRHLFEKIITNDARLERFLTEVCPLAWHEEQDAGRSWSRAVAERCSEYPDFAAEIRAFDERWPETIRSEIAGSTAIVAELAAAGVPLYALSNFSREKFDDTCQTFSFLGHFHGVLISGDVGLVKPDPAIFRLFLESCAVEATTALFIDDRLDNVKAAEACGFQTHHFASPTDLRADLASRGLLSSG